MFSPFACGNFSNQEEDDIDELLSPCTTPKRSRKSICSKRDSKNPYSNRGLDKFSAVLAELEDKKQKIYTQKGSEGISFVRFVYSNSNHWRPIVVKTKDRKQENGTNHADNTGKEKPMPHNSQAQDHRHTTETSTDVNEVRKQKKEEKRQTNKYKSLKWSLKLENLKHPRCYLPAMMILILLFLVMYGRSFAVLCTSLGWYVVPMIKERSSSSEKTKKDYVRRLSDKNMVNEGSSPPKSPLSSSPRSVLGGPAEKPSGQHDHRKSW